MKAVLSQCCISSDSDSGSVLIVIIMTALEHRHYSSPYILILFGLLKSVICEYDNYTVFVKHLPVQSIVLQ